MQPSQANSDEIDLLHLLANLTRFFVKNWLIIFLSIGASMAIAWISYQRAPKVYGSEMIVQSKFLSEAYASQVIKILQKQINDDEDSTVAEKLHLTLSEASTIEGIMVASPFSEKINMPEDDRIYFLFSVETSDPRVLPHLQSGLVFLFENLPYVKMRVAEKRKSYQNMIARIDWEIGHFDSLSTPSGSLYQLVPPEKKVIKQKNTRDVDPPTPVVFDPTTMSVFMTRERNENREKLGLMMNGIEIIQGFSPSRHPVKPDLSIYMASGFSSGVLLSILLLGLRSVQWLFKKYPA